MGSEGITIANLDLDILYESDYSKMQDINTNYDFITESYGDDDMGHISCSTIEIY